MLQTSQLHPYSTEAARGGQLGLGKEVTPGPPAGGSGIMQGLPYASSQMEEEARERGGESKLEDALLKMGEWATR